MDLVDSKYIGMISSRLQKFKRVKDNLYNFRCPICVDKTIAVYITEGPFDSTFICNSIAMCGADVDISNWGIINPVWIYDNEPRNREIVNRISRTIDNGNSIVIWPTNIIEKDINDMVLSGHDVMSVVELNTYSGLEAKIKFNNWKKI
jgi:hypothetical protein